MSERATGSGRGRFNPDSRQRFPRRPYDRAANLQNEPASSHYQHSQGGSAQSSGFSSNTIGSSVGRDKSETIITRPSPNFDKQGKQGTPHKQCVANCFEVLKRPDWCLMHHQVVFNPPLDSPCARKQALKQHEKIIGMYYFDGTMLYTVNRLPEMMEFVTVLGENSSVRISVAVKGQVRSRDPVYNKVFNIILRRSLICLPYSKIHNHFFDSAKEIPVPNYRLKIWPGIAASIRTHEDGLLLRVRSVHKVIRPETAHEMLRNIHSLWVQNGRREDLRSMVSRQLLGQVVITPYNSRMYRIDGVDYDTCPTSTFYHRHERREMSYVEYYERRHNLQITDFRQPCLVSYKRGPVHLIPEFCTMAGLTSEMKKDVDLVKALAEATHQPPNLQVASLINLSRRFSQDPEANRHLTGWGLQFNKELVRCDARILPPVEINQLSGTYRAPPGEGNKFVSAPPLNNWLVVYPQNVAGQLSSFLIETKHLGRSVGFPISDPHKCPLAAEQTRDYLDRIRQEFGRQQFQLVLVIFRRPRVDTYAAIKTLTCTDLAVPSQILTTHSMGGSGPRKKLILLRILLQLAVKIGAEPWRVEICRRDLMVCGYDLHRNASTNRAVSGFVASSNDTLSRYSSTVELHDNLPEISPNLHVHVVKALRIYKEENGGKLPKKIYFYRDEIHAKDLLRIRSADIDAIRSACRNVGTDGNYRPGIVYIVLSTRSGTRFFSLTGSGAENAPTGLVVDDTVTLHERFDFFLQSHGDLGAARPEWPTSYHVIVDSSQSTPDEIQSVTYALTHLYYNTSGSLPVPAPVQYARKLARLVGQCNLTTRPPDRLAKLPYYL